MTTAAPAITVINAGMVQQKSVLTEMRNVKSVYVVLCSVIWLT
jgi:hypothetical protein